ncbi:hypothetical protein [uncultured Treponema sp.]|uniref:pectate lyase family protein n=1 Tax=uncultured Treponema sp. TaxID=162155 RepID=UPI0025880C99|nr:hypothetical protein [uncultured Treponema sp.]
MKKNSQKRKFGTILLSLAALFAVLFSTAACKTDSDDDELNSVTISPSEATINANGQTSLFANVDKKGSGTPVYKWEIISGGEYATLEKETYSTCVVTGKNTTASAQSVKVKCTVTFASTTKEAEATVTVSAAKVELESVSITGSEKIESTANTELTATPAFSIEGVLPTVTYTWEITAGSDYAELSESTTGTVTLTGKNTDTAEHEVTVKVTATYDGTTKEATTTVKILAAGQVVENKVTSVTVSAGKDSIACNGSTTLTAKAEYSGNPEITYTWEITAGSDYAELSESTTETATLTAKNTTTAEHEVTVKVSASDGTNSVESTCAVTVGAAAAVETGNVIKASDTPLGFAGVNYAMPTFTNIVTVKTRNELMNAIKKENSLIYIDGMIDMSDEGSGSKLPDEGASNIAVSSVMDSWIASKTSNAYTTYAAWVEAYAAVCEKSTDDKKVGNSGNSSLCSMVWTLNNAWKSVIQLNLKSNTTIIGFGNNSGIRGGTISISGIKNVVIRNLTLVDSIDMFPHHEKNDGFNAQFDCITIQGSNTANIWIDHCTMKDTLVMQHVQSGTKEKWQNYDGLCDIKGDGKGITVSNCHMYHHDKTMLVGSDDDEGDNTVRKLSVINNHFDTCVQRLPMARNSQFHVLNNWYTFDTEQSVGDGKSKGDYCIGARKGALIYSEANYFDSNMQYSIRGSESTASTAKVYDTGSVDNNTKKTSEYTAVSSAPFIVPYSYEPMTAENAKTYVAANAGAGVWTVVK